MASRSGHEEFVRSSYFWKKIESCVRHPALSSSARPAVAVLASFFAARTFALPEPYWAAITTLVVTQSAPGTATSVARRRFLGTALGAGSAAALALWIRPGIWAVGAGIFLLGLLCSALGRIEAKLRSQFDRTTYRFAGIALAVVLLISRSVPVWVAALHRFLEVSIGIVVGLVLTFLWPDRPDDTPSK